MPCATHALYVYYKRIQTVSSHNGKYKHSLTYAIYQNAPIEKLANGNESGCYLLMR